MLINFRSFIFSIKTKAYIFTLACIAQTHVKILFSDSHGMKPIARNKIREYTKVLRSVLSGSVWLPALFFVQVVTQKCGSKSICFYSSLHVYYVLTGLFLRGWLLKMVVYS